MILTSCSSSELKNENEKLTEELSIAKSLLASCKAEVEELKNTPEQRLIRANRYLSEEKLYKAKEEFKGVVENFSGTQDSENAKNEIQKIEKIIEEKLKEEERKKALGYKVLAPSTNIKYDQLTVNFQKIWIGKRWSFDDHGREYSYRDAARGEKHILARVSINSKENNPNLPPVIAYKMSNGELRLIGKLSYEFRRWKDYGSYLGNHADYGNDFAHSSTIPFNLGLKVSEEIINDHEIYLVLKRKGCFIRSSDSYGRPKVQYKEIGCSVKDVLKVDDFDNDYVLVKKF